MLASMMKKWCARVKTVFLRKQQTFPPLHSYEVEVITTHSFEGSRPIDLGLTGKIVLKSNTQMNEMQRRDLVVELIYHRLLSSRDHTDLDCIFVDSKPYAAAHFKRMSKV